MNQTIQVIMVATVVLITGLLVAFMSSGTLTDLDKSTDKTENSKCQYQYEQIQKGNAETDDLTAGCKGPNAGPQAQNQLLASKYRDQLVGP